jgi:hypothetical protein
MVAVTRLLAIQYRTLFLVGDTGRIERENDPDRSPGPRFWLAGCVSGNISGVRSDVADDVAAEIAALVATEPPFADLTSPPTHLDRYIDLLARDAAAPREMRGLIYELPHYLQHESRVRLIDDESNEGRCLHQFFSIHGLPDGFAELGFRSISDLWRPWCVALVNGEVASVAFAARISETGAELGVTTAKAFRAKAVPPPRQLAGRACQRCSRANCSTALIKPMCLRSASLHAWASAYSERACGFYREQELARSPDWDIEHWRDDLVTAQSNPAISSRPALNSIVEPAKSSPTGSQRPPRCAARNASTTALKERRFSGRPRPWPSSG